MIIRTNLVELSTLDAVAYRQKLANGHSGVVILRYDSAQPGLAILNRHTGEPDPAANVPRDQYPLEAFQEALALTSGMPYSGRGKVRLGAVLGASTEVSASPAEEEQEGAPEDISTVSSADYAAIVKAYTNKKGELSYDLLNKTLIQAARSNPFVGGMVAQGESVDAIRDHVVKANFESVTHNRSLTVGEVERIVALLDEVSPRYVLRELEDEIKRLLGERKKL